MGGGAELSHRPQRSRKDEHHRVPSRALRLGVLQDRRVSRRVGFRRTLGVPLRGVRGRGVRHGRRPGRIADARAVRRTARELDERPRAGSVARLPRRRPFARRGDARRAPRVSRQALHAPLSPVRVETLGNAPRPALPRNAAQAGAERRDDREGPLAARLVDLGEPPVVRRDARSGARTPFRSASRAARNAARARRRRGTGRPARRLRARTRTLRATRTGSAHPPGRPAS